MSLEEATDQLKDMGQMLQRQVNELCAQVGHSSICYMYLPRAVFCRLTNWNWLCSAVNG